MANAHAETDRTKVPRTFPHTTVVKVWTCELSWFEKVTFAVLPSSLHWMPRRLRSEMREEALRNRGADLPDEERRAMLEDGFKRLEKMDLKPR